MLNVTIQYYDIHCNNYLLPLYNLHASTSVTLTSLLRGPTSCGEAHTNRI